ncbi:hypothetical protein M8J76_015121 [Diaphorina citri]|nr:hypothetical protein M8J76_015121 [Diaphorina citri]
MINKPHPSARRKSREKNKMADDCLRNIIGSCNTVHGMKFVRNPDLPLGHRILWLSLLLLAVVGVIFGGLEIWSAYSQSVTATTIHTTMYQYANTGFPSVTLCQASRIDWDRVEQLNLSSYSTEVQADIHRLLKVLSTLKFGQFNDLHRVRRLKHFEQLNQLDLNDLLYNTQHSCADIFADLQCWWRTTFLNCCDIFEPQKSLYGYCLAFNSDVSEISKEASLHYGLEDSRSYWLDATLTPRPRRAANHGPWSGLRFTIELIITDPSNHPFESGIFIPVNTLGDVSIWGDAIQTSARVSELSRTKRTCLFAWDETKLSRGYLRENCKVHCIQDAMLTHCGCVPHFLFYILDEEKEHLPACNVEGMLCLAKHRDYFNNFLPERPRQAKSELRHDEVGIYCDCPDNCKSQNYISKLVISKDAQSPSQLVLDIHYETPHCILYETDIIFGFLDALVAYGGIAGLFLGASVLSLMEIGFEIVLQVFKITRSLLITKNTEQAELREARSMMLCRNKHK